MFVSDWSAVWVSRPDLVFLGVAAGLGVIMMCCLLTRTGRHALMDLYDHLTHSK